MKKTPKAIKQAELARIIGVTPQHLNAVLNKRTRPSVDLAKKIEAETGTPWILWFADSPSSSALDKAAAGGSAGAEV